MVIIMQRTIDFMHSINPQLLYGLEKYGEMETIDNEELGLKYYKFIS